MVRCVERGLGSFSTRTRSSRVRDSLLPVMNGTRLSIPCAIPEREGGIKRGERGGGRGRGRGKGEGEGEGRGKGTSRDREAGIERGRLRVEHFNHEDVHYMCTHNYTCM